MSTTDPTLWEAALMKAHTTNTPLYAITAAVFLVGMALVSVLFLDSDKQTSPAFLTMTGLIVTTVPSLLAAAFAEKASRDIRNGVVQGKAKDGAADALAESGLTDLIHGYGQTTPAVMNALTSLLDKLEPGTAANPIPVREVNPVESRTP